MNEPEEFSPEEIERMLRATAPRAAGDSTDLDAETLALREGFLRLGGLLDQAAEFDEATLLAKVQQSVGEDVAVPARREREKQRRWLLPASIAGGVAAAAIVLLICQTFFNFDFEPEVTPLTTLPPVRIVPEVEPTLESADSLPWREGIDDRISLAQVRMREASYLPLRRTSLISVAEEIRAVQHELNTSSL